MEILGHAPPTKPIGFGQRLKLAEAALPSFLTVTISLDIFIRKLFDNFVGAFMLLQ
ncbi:MAG: hypothetical protein KJ950_06260 [Proteobacteria bacterium]|nr:hypothetical protein [Pseudomonadota bacterium]MBU1688722.1 hypothetical protein [Pseudomonadota bacterium]